MRAAAVIVPTYNRPARLAACLAALARLEAEDLEVVVIDDGGEADLAPVVAPYQGLVRMIRQANGGPAKARNAGAKAAEAEFIAFTDDDCAPEPGWLAALMRKGAGAPDALVGGHTVNLLRDDIYAATSQSLTDFLYDFYGAAEGATPFFTSNNIGCRRDAFLAVGGFDESFPLAAAEDRDLGIRWRASGRPLLYAPDAIVGHAHGMKFAGFWRQHSNYGRGAHHLHGLMRARGDQLPKVEGLDFYLGMFVHPLRARERLPLVQSALIFLSQVAMVHGYARERRARGRG